MKQEARAGGEWRIEVEERGRKGAKGRPSRRKPGGQRKEGKGFVVAVIIYLTSPFFLEFELFVSGPRSKGPLILCVACEVFISYIEQP